MSKIDPPAVLEHSHPVFHLLSDDRDEDEFLAVRQPRLVTHYTIQFVHCKQTIKQLL